MTGRTAGSALALLLLFPILPCHATQPEPDGQWTGGFLLEGRWVAVNVRFPERDSDQAGTADIIFPFYGGSDNAINVGLVGPRPTSNGFHFEIPTRAGKVSFEARRNADTITGTYTFGSAKGAFGLTRWARIPVEVLEQYYGAYRVSPDRVISILRGWGSARTLNYVDYETGLVGTLFPSSETGFFAGSGLAVSFPVTLQVSFDRDSAGNVTRLEWRNGGAQFSARRIPIREERVTFSNGDISLGGTLLLPETGNRHPVVIVTPGDYGTQRNQLRLWAHHYVSNGVAALVFDSRGAGESTGPVNSSSFSDLANDVLAAVEVLRRRADVDPARIGLFGFSNSAFTVTLAASRSHDVGFLILQSLVGVIPWQQEIFRAETQLRVDGFSEADIQRGAEFVRLKYEVAQTGQGWDRLEGIMAEAREQRWLAYTNPPNRLERLRQVYSSIMTYDPAPALEQLRMPILAIWGGRDTYLPVRETVAIFERSMARAGNRHHVVSICPECNHSLLESDMGSPSTGGIETNFPSWLWARKIDWLREHVGVP